MIKTDLIILAIGSLLISLFSYMAIRAERKLWRQCRKNEECMRMQRQITEGKSHTR
jgi:hypothetical protein